MNQLLDSCQTISYINYVNTKYPLNIQQVVSFLYLSHFNTLIPQPSPSYPDKKNKTQSTNKRNLDTEIDSKNVIITESQEEPAIPYRFRYNNKGTEFWKNSFTLIVIHVVGWVLVLIFRFLAKRLNIQFNTKYIIG